METIQLLYTLLAHIINQLFNKISRKIKGHILLSQLKLMNHLTIRNLS